MNENALTKKYLCLICGTEHNQIDVVTIREPIYTVESNKDGKLWKEIIGYHWKCVSANTHPLGANNE